MAFQLGRVPCEIVQSINRQPTHDCQRICSDAARDRAHMLSSKATCSTKLHAALERGNSARFTHHPGGRHAPRHRHSTQSAKRLVKELSTGAHSRCGRPRAQRTRSCPECGRAFQQCTGTTGCQSRCVRSRGRCGSCRPHCTGAPCTEGRERRQATPQCGVHTTLTTYCPLLARRWMVMVSGPLPPVTSRSRRASPPAVVPRRRLYLTRQPPGACSHESRSEQQHQNER